MKLNISYPATGCQKLIEVDDERKLKPFYEKRLAAEVNADFLGDEWKGYIVRISGGNDKQGFPMKQGVLTNGRVRLLLSKGHSCYRERRDGERRRKSVRGCIVDANLSVLALVIVKKGEGDIPGLTDVSKPRRLGPKRASKIRKLFNLSKKDDVRQYVVKRPLPAKEGKKAIEKAPKIQRLVTPQVLQRKRHKIALRKKRFLKRREEAAEYQKLLALRIKEAKERKMERKRSHSKSSVSRSDSTSVPPPPAKSQKTSADAKPSVAKTASKKTAVAPKKPSAPKVAGAPKPGASKSATGTKKPVPGSKATPKPQATKGAPKSQAAKGAQVAKGAPKPQTSAKGASKPQASGKPQAPKPQGGKSDAKKPKKDDKGPKPKK